ncbi:MAG: AraC family transcriptional regulator [Catenulispora sp.]|nr:AraC family transcriptional regulator [Catenulispora sp.]
MDVLSDALTVMRAGQPHANRHELYAPWGLRFSGAQGAGFHVVLQGSCWLLPPHDGAPIRLGAGDVAFLYGTGSHAIADSPTSSLAEFDPLRPNVARPGGDGDPAVVLCGAYQLDAARAHPLLSGLPPVVHLPARVGHHLSLRAALDLLGAELENPRPGSAALMPALLDTLLLYILRTWFEESAGDPRADSWPAALADPTVASALTAIHSAPDHQWTVAELAIRAGLSRAAFAGRFSALVGRPPLTYLTWWRMTIAARLLRESDAPLRMVARQTGYSSDIAFSAAFKREYGIAPGRYRATARHADQPSTPTSPVG